MFSEGSTTKREHSPHNDEGIVGTAAFEMKLGHWFIAKMHSFSDITESFVYK
jgi:hypothetical protein